jgi:PAS domain-containing protein
MANWLEQPFLENGIVSSNHRSLQEIDEERALAQAIVDTIREPLLVLDQNLRVVDANRAFYGTFKINPCKVIAWTSLDF